MELGSKDQAHYHFERATKLNDKLYEAFNDWGILYDSEKQITKARECYQKSLAIKPDFFFAIYNLGLSYKSSGEQSLAIQYYEKALQLKPNHQESLVSLGNFIIIKNISTIL